METFLAKEKAFMEAYFSFTGLQWRHYFGPEGPRNPPALHMWPAEFIGQVHYVASSVGFWYVTDS